MRLARMVLLWTLILPACATRSPNEPIRIGQVSWVEDAGDDLSSSAASTRQGIQLAFDSLPEERRTAAGRKIAVVFAAASGGEEQLRAEAVRLIKINRVAGLLGSSPPAPSERLARAADEEGIPLLLTTEFATLPRGDNAFSLAPNPEQRGRVLAQEWQHRQSDKRNLLVLVDPADAVASAVGRSFTTESRRLAPALHIDEQSFRDGAESARLLKSAPEAILLACAPTEFLKERQRLTESGFTGTLIYAGQDIGMDLLRMIRSGPGNDTPKSDKAGPIVLLTAYSPAGLSESGQRFARKYQERFGAPPDIAAAQAHDAALLWVDVIRKVGTPTPAHLREQLARTDKFESVTGPLSMKAHCAARRLFLIQIKGDDASLLATHEPPD